MQKYQALYRQWRSKKFSEIYGQDAIVTALERQIEQGRIAHAYLFCGTRGTGKTSMAKIFAKAVNCLDRSSPEPCGECEVCRAIENESCMDVIEIDAASNNSVDQIRDLREKVMYPPSLASHKVYIIDEVHMLSTGAFNALLKTLEEPPEHVIFILATTEPQRLLPTILSRCQRFDFHRISADAIVARMKVVMDGIGRTADEDALYEIARAAEGGMRDALSILDVCVASAPGNIDMELTRSVIGSTGREFMFDFMDALIAGDTKKALGMIDESMKAGRDCEVFARDVISHARNCMLAAVVGDTLADISEMTYEDAERYTLQAKKAPYEKFMRIMDLFIGAQADMRARFAQRTMLELCAVRACRPEDEKDATLVERLARVEDMLKNGVAPAAPAINADPNTPAETAKTGPAPARVEKPAAQKAAAPEEFARAVEELSQTSAIYKAMLPRMEYAGIDGDVINVLFDPKAISVMGVLKGKLGEMEPVFSKAYGRTVKLNLALKRNNDANAIPQNVKREIEKAYDIFGRDKITLTD